MLSLFCFSGGMGGPPPPRSGYGGPPQRGSMGGGPYDRNDGWGGPMNGGGGSMMNQPPPNMMPPSNMGGGMNQGPSMGSMGGPQGGMGGGSMGGGGGGGSGMNGPPGKTSTQVTIPKDVRVLFLCNIYTLCSFLGCFSDGWSYHWQRRRPYSQNQSGFRRGNYYR